MNIEEAKDKFCPFSDNGGGQCIADKCMAWEFDITNKLDVDKTSEIASPEEIATGVFNYPVFLKSTTKGWCKLIDKDK